MKRASYCFLQARRLGPGLPVVMMRASNFYFSRGHYEEALQCASSVLAKVREYDEPIFGYYDRTGIALADLLDRGLPVEYSASMAFLAHVRRTRPVPQVLAVWDHLRARSLIDVRAVREQLDYLFAARQYEAAAKTWCDFVDERGYRTENFVFNGGFDREWIGSRFDWAVTAIPEVEVARDTTVFKSGSASLRVDFLGTANLKYGHIMQSIWLPAGIYMFTAWVRTDGLTTDEGIRLRIVRANGAPGFGFVTEDVKGSTDWTRIQQVLSIPAPGSLAALQIVRRASHKFDSKIVGRAWIDDVELRPLSRAVASVRN
ncbi:MAG: hypothetical protein ACK5AZ_16190 [Bryobacteraceae bacterium]